MASYTPMMEQYLEIKRSHRDSILLYRLGDFYEMFFDDALTVSRELELTLTGRDCGQPERAPMCGVPYHSAEGYIARLIAKGYKVAICEQTEDPAQAKGLVRREVVRMITPGTVIEASMLEEGRNNFIAAVYMDSRGGGVCFCDMSTGEVYATQLLGHAFATQLLDELGRFSPRELVLSDAAFDDPGIVAFARDKLNAHVERAGEWRFVPEKAREDVKAQFLPEEGELEGQDFVVQAAGGLLSYLHETQKNGLSHISRLQIYSQAQFMGLDYTARRNLEITGSLRTGEKKGSLLWVLDYTKTAMGARLIRQWLEKPLVSVHQIMLRQNAVKALFDDLPARDGLSQALSQVLDMERIIGRITFGSANAKDLRALWQVCQALPAIRRGLEGLPSRLLGQLREQVDPLEDLAALIDAAIVEDKIPFSVREGGMIRPGYHPEVDRLRSLVEGGADRVMEIEARERAATGIPKLKVGYNRVFGYYIEITKSYTGQAPAHYVRKQTLTNCERYITPELKELEGEVLSANERRVALEYELFNALREELAQGAARVQATAQAVAAADVLVSFAVAARSSNYTMPLVDDSDVIEIQEGRHPVVERVLADGVFVPNDTRLDCGESRVYMITGPNMAGKSTFMRQVALIAIMAQCGSFVPALAARIGVCDRVFTRIGAADDLFSGRSTFMVEMNEVADILKNATHKSLLILDEIGRGTSTFDGMSIARAVLEHVADKKLLGAKTLFATHYHELCELENATPGIKNYNVLVKKRGDEIFFLKKIVPGGANDSYGIQVAKLAGLPDGVIRRAKEVLRDIEARSPGVLPVLAGEEEPGAALPDEDQLTLGSFAENEIINRLRSMEPDILTPREALTLLYELAKLARQAE